jgi:hypothetical protein
MDLFAKRPWTRIHGKAGVDIEFSTGTRNKYALAIFQHRRQAKGIHKIS